jgi:hypothetical protein
MQLLQTALLQPINRRKHAATEAEVKPIHIGLMALLGAIYMTVELRLPLLSHLPVIWHFAIAFLLVLPLSWILAIRFGSGVLVFVLFLSGMAAAIVIDALLDFGHRNLFPFEVLWWWIVVGPACGLGAIAGSRRKLKATV